MKKTTLLSLLAPIALALLSGCSTTVREAPKAPRTASVDEHVFVLPAGDLAPPGSMVVSWEPTVAPPPPAVVPRKLVAKPHLVSNKGTRGRLFVLPVATFTH